MTARPRMVGRPGRRSVPYPRLRRVREGDRPNCSLRGPYEGGAMTDVRHGILLVADISGYTRFLNAVELEHSTDLIADLLGVVVEQTKGVLELAKIEGDAVFCYGMHDVGRTELLTLVEAAYLAFRRRQRDVNHLTT